MHGDAHRGITARQFDRIFAVFDRDDHHTYAAALAKAIGLTQHMQNDERRKAPFQAIASIPCFELWLLLHFEDVLASLHRDEVYLRLKKHLPLYQKGDKGLWESTKTHLAAAQNRATSLAQTHTAAEGIKPYTNMHELIQRLMQLKN